MRCKIFWHQNSLKGVAWTRSSVRRILAAAAAAGHTFAVPGTHAAATECTAAAPPRCLFIRGKTVRRFLRGLSVCRQRTDRAAVLRSSPGRIILMSHYKIYKQGEVPLCDLHMNANLRPPPDVTGRLNVMASQRISLAHHHQDHSEGGFAR